MVFVLLLTTGITVAAVIVVVKLISRDCQKTLRISGRIIVQEEQESVGEEDEFDVRVGTRGLRLPSEVGLEMA